MKDSVSGRAVELFVCVCVCVRTFEEFLLRCPESLRMRLKVRGQGPHHIQSHRLHTHGDTPTVNRSPSLRLPVDECGSCRLTLSCCESLPVLPTIAIFFTLASHFFSS
jgi:hypothetical protein